jgi:ParB-like nuclease domain
MSGGNNGESAKHRNAGVSQKSLSEISPSIINRKVYRAIDPDDPEVIALAEDIAKRGVLEPIVISSDDVIASGHRRYAASKLAGLTQVPCISLPLHSSDAAFLELLLAYNLQRKKSLDEILREEVAAADPEEAYSALIEHRKAKSATRFKTIEIVGKKTRCKISEAKRPFVDAITKNMDALRPFWPLSDRTIHYGLLNAQPLKHAGKPDSAYANDPESYNALTELLTRMRFEGIIPFDSISDDTRPVDDWPVHANVAPFVRSEIDNFMKGYWRDLMQSQPNHVEIVYEKLTLRGILRSVAMKYTIKMVPGRGYCTARPRWDMQQRFLASGKEKLILLCLSDFDPDGQEISHSLVRSMQDEFGVPVEGVQVALTAAQVKRFKLPPKMKASDKESKHRDKFIAKHGDDVFELEALRPNALQNLLEDAIRRVIDIDMFNAEVDAEKADAAFNQEQRARFNSTLKALIKISDERSDR